VKFDKRRQTKLDKLEKEGGRIIRSPKNTKYTVGRKAVKFVIFKNHYCYTETKKGDLKTIQDL